MPREDSDEFAERFHRDRRQHGGASQHPDDITQTDVWQEERAEIRREEDKDELLVKGERDPFPPTRYE